MGNRIVSRARIIAKRDKHKHHKRITLYHCCARYVVYMSGGNIITGIFAYTGNRNLAVKQKPILRGNVGCDFPYQRPVRGRLLAYL